MNSAFTFFILISGISAGVILFQSFIVASSIFKVLPEENAGLLLRNLFPKFFLFLAALALVGLAIGLVNGLKFFPLVFLQLLNFIFFVVCYSLIPATNRARDQENKKTFGILHTVSVLLTLLALIFNLSLVFLI
ncbi:MAG: DUF4149 domain-containing protein [Pseudomonadota bacterium]|jgi:hypothetical protein|nr:DUF4149 domain-containing protein [Pseudomonadota bacterium]|tara:strand:+ start:321 stop:722 length:402 start_codon:yes stop_codon:yes gene_type:complete